MTHTIAGFAVTTVMLMAATAVFGAGQTDVWVLLSEPPVAAAGSNPDRLRQQQDEVMAQLKELGAKELARVTVARSALAITIDSSKIPQVKRIVGVRSVSPIRHIERDPVPAPPPTK